MKVTLNPMQLLKMKGNKDGHFTCGCRSGQEAFGRSMVHPSDAPTPLQSPATPIYLDSPLVTDIKIHQADGRRSGMPAAESSEEPRESLLASNSHFQFSPGMDLSKLAVVPSVSQDYGSSGKFALPPIKPPKAHKAFTGN